VQYNKKINKNKIMAKKVNGRFYFKKTDNGNLIGEFSNNQDDNIYTESADLIKSCANKECANCKYHGTYHSSWQEECEALFAELEISPKKGSAQLFTLEWFRKDSSDSHKELIFVGEGMLCDGILFGDYHGVN
jgi:hypothetical protein